MSEASTRTAELLSGQVNWIEAPSPDTIPRLQSAGMRIVTNVYPHHWSYMLNHKRGPFTDPRVRQAANLVINRADMIEMLCGTAMEGHAIVPPTVAYYGNPPKYPFDPVKARMDEAGFDMTIQSMDWYALLDVYRAGVEKFPNYDGLNFSRGLLDAVNAIIKQASKVYRAPVGSNWGHYARPGGEKLVERIFNEFEQKKQVGPAHRIA